MRRLRYYESHFSHKEVSNMTKNLGMKLTKSWGMILLSIWLIVTGLIALLSFSFQGLHLIMAILAIAAGVLILLGR
jgi:hypothetical protein